MKKISFEHNKTAICRQKNKCGEKQDMLNKIKSLLYDISVTQRLTKTPQKSASSYNIFQALQIEWKEVHTCRFIASLLSPNGKHGLGLAPLCLFFWYVLGLDTSPSPTATVTLEEVITDNRRVDIVIRNDEHVYPIEVKIWAGDQNVQLADYYHYYFETKKYTDKKIYYLTPTGWMPSLQSVGNRLDKKCIVLLSFEKHISLWLKKVAELEHIDPGLKRILEQYQEVLNEMCKTSKEEKAVMEAIGLDKTFAVTDNLCALVSLLDLNGDKNGSIQKAIQKAYLRRFLDFDTSKYIFVDTPEQEVIQKAGNHVLLFIGTKGENPKTVAWVCVDKNLYLRCEKLEEVHSEIWKDECWVYIKPDDYYSGEKYRLDDCRNALAYSGKIKIGKLLDEIKGE